MFDQLLLTIVLGNVILILGSIVLILSRSRVRQMIAQLLNELTYSRQSHEKKWRQQIEQNLQQIEALKLELNKVSSTPPSSQESIEAVKEVKHFRSLYQNTQQKLEKAEKKLSDLLRLTENKGVERNAQTPVDEIYKLKCDKADLQDKLNQMNLVLERTVNEDNQSQRLTLLEQQSQQLQNMINQQEEEITLLEAQNLLLQQQSPDSMLQNLVQQFIDDAQTMMAYILELEEAQQQQSNKIAQLEPLALSRTEDDASKAIADLQQKLETSQQDIITLNQQIKILQAGKAEQEK